MLRELHIRNYAIVEEVSLCFSDHLHVITGETGAGKSILVDALSALLGGRSSADDIRHGAEEAILEAQFDSILYPEESEEVSDLSPDLLLKRVLSRSRGSRVYLNGSLTTLALLQERGRRLAEIHGQHAHHHLTQIPSQLHLLDSFGQLLKERTAYQDDYRQWTELVREREALQKRQLERGREESFLQYQWDEIHHAGLSVDEEESLQREALFLKNRDAILEAGQKGYALLAGEGAVLQQLDGLGGALRSLRDLVQDVTQEEKLYESSRIDLKEVAESLRRRFHETDADPDRLNKVTERLFLIQNFKKKYGPSIAAIFAYQEELKEKLTLLVGMEAGLSKMGQEIARYEAALQETSKIISKKRHRAAEQLGIKVHKELSLLGMEKTHFKIKVEAVPLSESGADRIEFLIALPGEPYHGLAQIASGGELARIMLALKVVLAEVDPVPTLVFDEIDSGIGGAVAEKVGVRLAELAKRHQVICLTHLPQIAAAADHHYRVEQKRVENRVIATVRDLNNDERVQEVARMLGGVTVTPITLRHAKEMIARGSG